MRLAGVVLSLVLAVGSARAAETDLTGRATIGTEERTVTLRLSCRPASPGLAATLTVPHFADLAAVFDFDAFEGASGSTAALTGILVSGAGGVRSARTAASGAVAADPATSFTLTVAGESRGQDPLRAIAPGMAEPGARIVWTQASPRKGDGTLVATFPVADAAALRTALEPCFAR